MRALHAVLLLLLAHPLLAQQPAVPNPPPIAAKAYLLADFNSGQLLASQNPHQRIDYVLATESFATTDAQVPTTDAAWQALSDHLPVIVALSHHA